ncbi:Amino-acid permease inda1 [Hypoxylon texense]
MTREDTDWLTTAEYFIQQDLETTVKELDLVRDALETLEASPKPGKKPGPSLEDRKFLIGACQEYSGSRCYMLEERLRQIRLWAGNRQMGEDIPDRVPDEWPMVDVEWREWLSEQASSQIDEPEAGLGVAVKHWGPLFPLLIAYTERGGV